MIFWYLASYDEDASRIDVAMDGKSALGSERFTYLPITVGSKRRIRSTQVS